MSNNLTRGLQRLGMTYAQYLKSPHWVSLRARFFRSRPRQCWICNSVEDIALHHRTYLRLGAERMSDLVPLCQTHHQTFHTENPGFCSIFQKTNKFLLEKNKELLPGGIRRKINGRFSVRDLSAGRDKWKGNFKDLEMAKLALAKRVEAMPTREPTKRQKKRIIKRAARKAKQKAKTAMSIVLT